MGTLSVQSPHEPRDVWSGYTQEPLPLAGYAVLMGIYVAGTSAVMLSAANSNRLPRSVSTRDLVLLGIATHKLTRIITKDWVTSPLRAPFTRYVKSLGAGEQVDESRGSGMRRAIGDLLTCPFCSGPWVATGLVAGLLFRPRTTRILASMLAMVTLSDYLHQGWDYTRAAAKNRKEDG